MTDIDRIRQLGAGLVMLLDEQARRSALKAFEDAGSDLDALIGLVDRLAAREQRREALIRERELHLELVLGILRSRDQKAAEEAEWDFATDLQTSGLPQDFPAFPDRPEFDLHAGMVTAKEVGGDLYDFFLIAPTKLGFVVADAAGKGLPAAIFITLTRTLLRAAAQRLNRPSDCLDAVNAMLCIDNPTIMFTTAFYGVLDTETGMIFYANAGHNPPYLLRANGSIDCLVGTGAMALGIMEDMRYQTQSAQLAPGETLVCFSDGVTEATGIDGKLYGEARLISLFKGQTGMHPEELLTTIIANVDGYMGLAPMADDVTLLILRYNGFGGAST